MATNRNGTVKATIEMPDGTVGTFFVPAKDFSTGSTGYFTNGRIQIEDGRRYTVNVQMVEIGSKERNRG